MIYSRELIYAYQHIELVQKGENIMSLYQSWPLHRILLRRAGVIIIGTLALPVMLFWKDRARFYSYLHRIWMKTSDKPVWLAHAESAAGDFY